ncbi:MAG: anaerobic ribonucleoside-triphosphate reductase activating protein [Acetobacteraceae bacterium]
MSVRLPIGGFVPFSTADFPGRLAAVVFTAGCPLACRYCHNPHLRGPRPGPDAEQPEPGLTWESVLARLATRRGVLDGVVFSGGEPTIHRALPAALAAVRTLGFATGLHTSGCAPESLARALPLLDWVGLDVKAAFTDYARITGRAGAGARARRSLDLVLASGVAYELRTTIHPALLGPADLDALAADLAPRGVRKVVLQPFRPAGCADAGLAATAPAASHRALPPAAHDIAWEWRGA